MYYLRGNIVLVVVLALAHVLADFYFQSENLAEKKVRSFKHLLIHTAIYAATSFVLLAAIFSPSASMVIAFFACVVLHFAIDFAKVHLQKKLKKKHSLAIFFADQAAHLLAMVGVCFGLRALWGLVGYSYFANWFNSWAALVGVFALLFLVVIKPAAIAVKEIIAFASLTKEQAEQLILQPLAVVQKEGQQQEKDLPAFNAGVIIGILERLIVVILVLAGQYGAIAFVMAAKSLARFKQLEDKDFAEKYLVGTLSSMAIALVVGAAAKWVAMYI